MKRFLKKITNWLYLTWVGLFYGLKSTDKEIFTQSGIDMGGGISMDEEMHTNRISHDLLAGKETQAVKELRYRTYQVDRESKNYEYFSPYLATKREKQDSKFVKFENEDNLPIITVQNNTVDVKGVLESLKEVDRLSDKPEYTIKITRSKGFLPRYRIEEYTKRLVVKELEKNTKAILDFYVSMYPNEEDVKSKGFVNEIKRIKENGTRSDIIDLKTVYFITNHAYLLDDMIEFKFNEITFKDIKEFDGHYIISFISNIVINGKDLVETFKSKTMEEKYKNKERKNVVYDLNPSMIRQVYHCEDCGKEIIYDVNEIDDMEVRSLSDLDNNGFGDGKTTEYFDMQMAEQTLGKKLCRNCLSKYIINKNEIKNELKYEYNK